ncbi:MAG: response regulator, partial [Thiolinea sp.]
IRGQHKSEGMLRYLAVSSRRMCTVPYFRLPTSLIGGKVLLVDDDEMNRFFGKKLIESLGVDVEVADNGESALELLQEQRFDLVFMDISMPGMDGYETTRAIRANHRLADLPVIALTAHAIMGERERCMAAGMNQYLTKPFEEKALTRLLSASQ